MLHEFKAGTLDATKCVHCKRAADMHECDICGKAVSVQLKYGNMLMCAACTETEEKLYAESQKPENVAARITESVAKTEIAAELNSVLRISRETDDAIEVRGDLFNAATTAIVDLKKAIDEDAAIVNKPYALAEELKNRFEKFKAIVFELQQQIVEAGNNQKAIQVYLNQLANTLRAEEREKLKISDLSYQPAKVKPATPKPIKTAGTRKSSKLDKSEIRRVAAELGVPEFSLQMIVVSKGVTIVEAGRILKASIDNAMKQA